MFVITADQINSRTSRNRANELIAALTSTNQRYLLPPDQTSGDEIQILTNDPSTALNTLLTITKTTHWYAGVGIGVINAPLPAATRLATGPAFIAARRAVNRAKTTSAQFALETESEPAEHTLETELQQEHPKQQKLASKTMQEPITRIHLQDNELEGLLSLLILVRQRRTPTGWEITELLDTGHNQKTAAQKLGITAGAASQRVRTSLWRIENNVKPALIKLLDAHNIYSSPVPRNSSLHP